MFVAVVYKYHDDTAPKSHRTGGGWESFLGNSEEEAVEQALIATARYETEVGRGPYKILVGEASKEVSRFQYTLIDHDTSEDW